MYCANTTCVIEQNIIFSTYQYIFISLALEILTKYFQMCLSGCQKVNLNLTLIEVHSVNNFRDVFQQDGWYST